MGMLILAVGGIVTLVGAIMIWIPAFKEHIGWGIGSVLLFIPIGLIFAFMHWADCKKGFMVWLVGFIVYIIGLVIGGAEFLEGMNEMNMQDPQYQ